MSQSGIDGFITNFCIPSAPGDTLSQVIDILSSNENRAQDLLKPLMKNPLYGDLILKVDILQERINRWMADDSIEPHRHDLLLEKTLGLLGRAAIRNSLFCIRVQRISKLGIPIKKADRFLVTPREQIKCALLVEEFCEKHKLALSDQAYLAGLHFDWLRALAIANKATGDIKVYVDQTFKRALKAALIAYQLGSIAETTKYDSQVFAGTLLSWSGRVIQYILYPKDLEAKSWFKFEVANEKLGDEAELAFLIREPKHFEWTHAELAALYATSFRFFAPIEKALNYYLNPSLLKSIDHDLYDLSALIHLSNRLSRIEDIKTFEFSKPIAALVKDLKLSETTVKQIAGFAIQAFKEG